MNNYNNIQIVKKKKIIKGEEKNNNYKNNYNNNNNNRSLRITLPATIILFPKRLQ